MEKLGVAYEEEAVKTASTQKKTPHCPKCGEECVQDRQFLMWCPNCGTEPWEKKPEAAAQPK